MGLKWGSGVLVSEANLGKLGLLGCSRDKRLDDVGSVDSRPDSGVCWLLILPGLKRADFAALSVIAEYLSRGTVSWQPCPQRHLHLSARGLGCVLLRPLLLLRRLLRAWSRQLGQAGRWSWESDRFLCM